ncbi:hypothetical protein J6590_003874 [Homalodisca vitripennis]|nr:hypothetical protein J6590_003874 [Homalodisca vitripennis]
MKNGTCPNGVDTAKCPQGKLATPSSAEAPKKARDEAQAFDDKYKKVSFKDICVTKMGIP